MTSLWRGITSAALSGATLVTVASAQPLRATGSNTGDGSTAFTGLARAPEANLFVGAATSAVPIEVPRGRPGVTPQLALAYSSSAGAGPYGFGWDLPLGHIQHQSKHGVVACDDPRSGRDFVLVLGERRIECRLDPATQRCLPLVESDFLRIEWHAATTHWEVRDKGGMRFWLGDAQTARSPIYPQNGCLPFTWSLTRIEDPNGNYLRVVYDNVAETSYPQRILYGGNTSSGFSPPFEVRFAWGTEQTCQDGTPASRPCDDRLLNGLGGYAARLTRLLSAIQVFYRDNLVRTYQLQYDFEIDGAEHAARRSFLTAVTLFDGNGEALTRADGEPATTTFLYRDSAAALGFQGIQDVAAPPPLAQGVGRWKQQFGAWHPTVREIFDLDGDGFADLVDTTNCSDAWDVYRGSVNGFAVDHSRWDTTELLDHCRIRAYDVDDATIRFVYDTLDLTGDGIPDFIDTSEWTESTPYWRVHPGQRPTATTIGGFGAAIRWPAPRQELRQSRAGRHFLGWDGSSDEVDLIDMNADGLPDLLESGAPWRLWRNTGSGFDLTPRSFATGYRPLRFTTSFGLQVLGLVDINGDGLPDQVETWDHSGGAGYRGTWNVRLHSGFGMSAAETWPVPGSRCWWGSDHGWDGLTQSLYDGTDVVRDLFDINGDGLPDIVDTCGYSAANPVWSVQLNRGGGFAPPRDWRSTAPLIRDLDDHVHNGGGKTFGDVFDIDGDGLVDQVRFSSPKMRITRNAGGAWCASAGGICVEQSANVARSDTGRPDLLVQVENGIGGSTYLEYRPSTDWDNTDPDGAPRLPLVLWTLSAIERDDGMCGNDSCVSGGEHWLRTDIEYAYGFFDPEAREFRGFRAVRSYNASNRRDTYFHQDAVRRGRTQSESAFDDSTNQLLSYAYLDWSCLDLDDPACSGDPGRCPVLADCPTRLDDNTHYWVRLAETNHFATSGGRITHGSAQRNLAWDRFGNVTHRRSFGTGTAAVDAYTTYAQRDDAEVYIADKPLYESTAEGGASALRTLAARWFAYDQQGFGTNPRRGNLTTVWSWLDRVITSGLPQGEPCPSTSGRCWRTDTRYDNDVGPGYGNIIAVRDPAGHETQTSFDNETHVHPETVTNAVGFRVTTRHDPACGTRRSETSPYRPTSSPTPTSTQYVHDSFCRPLAIVRPGQSLTAPQVQYRYVIGAPGIPTDVVTIHAEPGSPTRVTSTHALYDALGRRLQVQSDAVIDGVWTTRVSETTELDAAGNVQRSFAPFAATFVARGNGAAYQRPRASSGADTFLYDAAQRRIVVAHSDGTARRTEYNGWTTTTTDECLNDGGCSGARIVEKRDAFGRIIEKQTYDGTRFETATRFDYDGLGRLLRTTQGTAPNQWNAATRVAMEYDSLGRKVRLVDPDSGEWRYGYDAAGNLIYQDDPQTGRHTEICFDALRRMSRKFYAISDSFTALCDTAAAGDVVHHHDSYHDGFDDRTGGATALGRLTHVSDSSGSTHTHYDRLGRTTEVTTTIAAGDGSTVTGAVQYAYDAADRVQIMTYPDGERVRYRYDAAGQIKSIKGKKVYVRRLTYDIFGRPRSIKRGNRTIDTRTYGSPAQRSRLAQIDTKRGSSVLLDYRYPGYTANGLLTSIEDVGPSGGAIGTSNAMQFEYDGLGRLASCSAPGQAPLQYQYDALGNLVFKEGRTLTYSGARPHVLASVDGVALEHDANGNRTLSLGNDFEYDGDGRLITVNGGGVRYAYNHEGQRVLREAFGGPVTRYFGRIAAMESGHLTKFYYAGDLLIASQRIPTWDAIHITAPRWQWAPVVGSGRYAAQLRLRRDTAAQAAFLLAVASLLALSIPGRARVRGWVVRRGFVVWTAAAFLASSLPCPVVVSRAGALPSGIIQHYHLDHLGSTHLVTDRRGQVIEQIRYTPYGEVWARIDGNAQSLPVNGCAGGQTCRSFTGYESDATTGLQYAGARLYDPQLGSFLTPDPARQFPNPYSYGGGNPISATDPSGTIFGIDDAIFAVVMAVVGNPTVAAIIGGAAEGAVVGAAIGGIQAAATGNSLLRGIGMGAALGLATGGAGGAGGLGAAVAVGAGVGAMRAVLVNQDPLNAALIGAATGFLGYLGEGIGPASGSGVTGYFKNAAIEIGTEATVGAIGGGLGAVAADGAFGAGALQGAAVAAGGSGLGILGLGAKMTSPHSQQALHQEFNNQSWYDRSGLLLTMPAFGTYTFRVGGLLPQVIGRDAITLGGNVVSANGSLDARTMAHELRHVAQVQTLGVLSMGFEYARIIPAQIRMNMTGDAGELYSTSSALGARLEPKY